MITHGADLVRVFHPSHPRIPECLGCNRSANTVALVRLVFTFEPCDCGTAPYVHLVERTWHRICFATADRDVTTEGDDR